MVVPAAFLDIFLDFVFANVQLSGAGVTMMSFIWEMLRVEATRREKFGKVHNREILLRVNQALYKPGSTQSLMSTPQVRDSGTRVNTTWVQHDETSNFGVVLESEEYGRLVVPFTLNGVSSVNNIKNKIAIVNIAGHKIEWG